MGAGKGGAKGIRQAAVEGVWPAMRWMVFTMCSTLFPSSGRTRYWGAQRGRRSGGRWRSERLRAGTCVLLIYGRQSVRRGSCNTRRQCRSLPLRLVSIGDSIEPMGYALAFPFRAASTDVFSRAVTAALYGGTMTAYRARYRIRSQVYLAYMSCLYVTMTAYRARYRMCPQDNACTEEAPEGGDKMDIRSMSGLFVSVAVVMFAALVYSFVEKGDLLASLQAARRAARGQPHTPHPTT